MPDELHFYSRLAPLPKAITEMGDDLRFFVPVPENWLVLLTDIRNSTGAYEQGKHQMVNLIASGSIISVLNIAHRRQVEIPFFFGGDGASMLIPSTMEEECLKALMAHRANTKKQFDLELRVGSLPVRTLYEHKQKLWIAKSRINRFLSIPVIYGNGLKYAETEIKRKTDENVSDEEMLTEPDLSGMECRWNRIKPPNPEGEVLCLLVDSRVESDQWKYLSHVLGLIDQIYGPLDSRNPISVPRLKLSARMERIRTEMLSKIAKWDWSYFLKTWVLTATANWWYHRSDSGRQYMENLVLLSDTLVLDGRINTVITGKESQRVALLEALDRLETENRIVYGWYVSSESIISCYVRNRDNDHLHFVDGSEGGYTQSARMLKAKWKMILEQ